MNLASIVELTNESGETINEILANWRRLYPRTTYEPVPGDPRLIAATGHTITGAYIACLNHWSREFRTPHHCMAPDACQSAQ